MVDGPRRGVGDLPAGEPELGHRHGVLAILRFDDEVGQGGEVEDADEFGDVDVLGGQAAAQDVVGVGHDLDSQAADVGVELAGVEVDRLAGLQGDVVEQQRAQDTDVARVAVLEFEDGAQDLGDPVVPVEMVGGGGDHGVDELGAGGAGDGDPGGEQPAEAVGLVGRVEDGEVAVELGAGEDVEELPGLLERAEAGHGVELGEGDDEFGLVAGVLVVTVAGAQGDALVVLAGVALLGLLGRRMGLQGQGLGGGEELEQEGQAVAVLGAHAGTQGCVGVGGDDVGQGRAVDGGRGAGVGAEPQLGLGPVGRHRQAAQLRDERARSPRVGPEHSGQLLH